MGFTQARRAVLEALRTGAYQHEAREVLNEKNLLAVGDVSAEDVIAVLRRARGTDYSESPHHWDASVAVHLFQPRVESRRWYIKVYFLDTAATQAVFISVHWSS